MKQSGKSSSRAYNVGVIGMLAVVLMVGGGICRLLFLAAREEEKALEAGQQ
ncbi:MAG: hypothetical protein ACE5F1_17900 [Planctomycetota bacterium]